MKKYVELMFYVSFAAGMAFGTSSFTMMSGLFEVTTAPWVVAAIILSGLICMVISTSVAEMASMYPSAPGIRTYLKAAFGNRFSLVLVYLYLIFMVLIAGVESYMFALVVKAVFPAAVPIYVVLGLIAFTVAVNGFGLELPRDLQIITTFALILLVLVLGVYGITHAPAGARWEHFIQGSRTSELKLLPAGVIMAVFLFTGFEWVTLLGFSPKSYERKIPVSMPLAILTNMCAYTLFVVGMSIQMPRAEIAATPVPQVPYFLALMGGWGVWIAWGLSLLAVFSTFNAGIMGGSRLIYVLTREGNLPKWCALSSARTGAPLGGIIVLGGSALLSSWCVVVFELELLAAVIGSTIVALVYTAFMLATLRLRQTQPNMRRSFRATIPRWLQWSVIVLMPIMGIATLFSQAGAPYRPALGMVVFLLVSLGLAHWSVARGSQARAARAEKA